ELGIPITTERGRHGAYMLVAGFKLPPMMFTDAEALALSMGLLAARSLGLHAGETALASAQAKLERVMPDSLTTTAAQGIGRARGAAAKIYRGLGAIPDHEFVVIPGPSAISSRTEPDCGGRMPERTSATPMARRASRRMRR